MIPGFLLRYLYILGRERMIIWICECTYCVKEEINAKKWHTATKYSLSRTFTHVQKHNIEQGCGGEGEGDPTRIPAPHNNRITNVGNLVALINYITSTDQGMSNVCMPGLLQPGTISVILHLLLLPLYTLLWDRWLFIISTESIFAF